MKITEILSEEKKPRYSLMYHATSDKFLRSILKNGLLANPPKKTYDFDSEHPDAVASFGGVYLTPNMIYARSIGNDSVITHGGDRIFITIQYQHGSGELDEDLVIDEFEKVMLDYHAVLTDKADKKGFTHSTFEYDEFIENLIVNDFKSFAKFLGEHMIAQLGNIGRLGRTIPKLILELAKFVRSYVMYEQSYMHKGEDIHNFMIRPREFLREYSEFENLITNMMKNIYPHSEKSAHALRLTRNIGYRGKTKIIQIVRENGELVYRHPAYEDIILAIKGPANAT